MKKLILALFFFLGASPVFAAIALVSSSEGHDYSGSGFFSYPTAALSTTTGNLIVIATAFTGHNSLAISDTAGNTYIHDATCYKQSTNDTDIWYAKNITGNAANIVTVSFPSSAQYIGIVQAQYSGASTTAPFELCVTGTATGTSITSPSFSPAASGNVNVATVNGDGGSTYSAGSGYTDVSTTGNYTENKIGASAGAQTASINSSASLNLEISVGSFKTPVAPADAVARNGLFQNGQIN